MTTSWQAKTETERKKKIIKPLFSIEEINKFYFIYLPALTLDSCRRDWSALAKNRIVCERERDVFAQQWDDIG